MPRGHDVSQIVVRRFVDVEVQLGLDPQKLVRGEEVWGLYEDLQPVFVDAAGEFGDVAVGRVGDQAVQCVGGRADVAGR